MQTLVRREHTNHGDAYTHGRWRRGKGRERGGERFVAVSARRCAPWRFARTAPTKKQRNIKCRRHHTSTTTNKARGRTRTKRRRRRGNALVGSKTRLSSARLAWAWALKFSRSSSTRDVLFVSTYEVIRLNAAGVRGVPWPGPWLPCERGGETDGAR